MGAEQVHFDPNAAPEDMNLLGERLDAFNVLQTQIADTRPLRIAVRDEEGRLIGGLSAVTNWGWLYIKVIWVDEKYRRSGVGACLLQMAEDEATRRGCGNACLTSFSYQAPEFYRRRGYQVFGELEDYPAGQTLFFFRKPLRSS